MVAPPGESLGILHGVLGGGAGAGSGAVAQWSRSNDVRRGGGHRSWRGLGRLDAAVGGDAGAAAAGRRGRCLRAYQRQVAPRMVDAAGVHGLEAGLEVQGQRGIQRVVGEAGEGVRQAGQGELQRRTETVLGAQRGGGGQLDVVRMGGMWVVRVLRRRMVVVQVMGMMWMVGMSV